MTRLRAEGGGEVRRESSFGGAAAQAERRAAVSARAVSIEDSDEASSGLASVVYSKPMHRHVQCGELTYGVSRMDKVF